MKPIALTLSKNMYEYLITNLHKNATLVFCTYETIHTRRIVPFL